MAVTHTGLQQDRSVLGLGFLDQLQLPVPRPNKCSCCVFGGCFHGRLKSILKPDILRTLWSNRPDIVFLLESSRLLNDLTCNKLHTELGVLQVDYRRCLFRKRRCCDYLQNCAVDILLRRDILHSHSVDIRRCKFSIVDLHVDKGSFCRCRLCSSGVLLCIL